ncbi:PREDICTED: OTU domain-containing protein 6B [Aptenodytes forsteri]|nr:PREDICTED: OTU domain-containing protein 6B [Aptenodytes forsteri]
MSIQVLYWAGDNEQVAPQLRPRTEMRRGAAFPVKTAFPPRCSRALATREQKKCFPFPLPPELTARNVRAQERGQRPPSPPAGRTGRPQETGRSGGDTETVRPGGRQAAHGGAPSGEPSGGRQAAHDTQPSGPEGGARLAGGGGGEARGGLGVPLSAFPSRPSPAGRSAEAKLEAPDGSGRSSEGVGAFATAGLWREQPSHCLRKGKRASVMRMLRLGRVLFSTMTVEYLYLEVMFYYTSPTAKIQGMKNAVPKNDKKRRKQLADEVAKLEAELEQKHKEELKQLKEVSPEQNKTDSIADGVANLELEGVEQQSQHPRISKAQKRREKKAALEKEREERIAEAEIENLTGARHLESQKLASLLAARHLEIKQIPSDGHCMYRAIEDQLKDRQNSWTVAALRNQTAKYMQSHFDDFLPFLTNPSTGNMYSREEFEKYCDDIENTAAWGGQLELRALSHILQTPIEVVQMNSPPIIVGEEYSGKPIILVYMRHAYGLGEHYNSVKLLTDAATENGS